MLMILIMAVHISCLHSKSRTGIPLTCCFLIWIRTGIERSTSRSSYPSSPWWHQRATICSWGFIIKTLRINRLRKKINKNIVINSQCFLVFIARIVLLDLLANCVPLWAHVCATIWLPCSSVFVMSDWLQWVSNKACAMLYAFYMVAIICFWKS